MNWHWIAQLCARHLAAHAFAQACALMIVPAMFVAALLWQRAERRVMQLTRENGGCVKEARRGVHWMRASAAAVMMIPPVVYAITSWVLDGTLTWDCTFRPEVDFTTDRATVVAVVVAATTLIPCVFVSAKRLIQFNSTRVHHG